jgi:hypothetical protein
MSEMEKKSSSGGTWTHEPESGERITGIHTKTSKSSYHQIRVGGKFFEVLNQPIFRTLDLIFFSSFSVGRLIPNIHSSD